jgi:hypothetical protein
VRRRVDPRKTEAEAEQVRPGCWGQLMERLDTFNRRFRPKCRRAVKSQVVIINKENTWKDS